jgi:ribonuclease HI
MHSQLTAALEIIQQYGLEREYVANLIKAIKASESCITLTQNQISMLASSNHLTQSENVVNFYESVAMALTNRKPSSSQEPIIVYTDGSGRSSAHRSGCGCIIEIDGRVIRCSEPIEGPITIMNAEYAGILLAVKKLRELNVTGRTVLFKGDAQSVMHQLNGKANIKNNVSRIYYELIHEILREQNLTVSFQYIKRHKNHVADKLSKMATAGILINDKIE